MPTELPSTRKLRVVRLHEDVGARSSRDVHLGARRRKIVVSQGASSEGAEGTRRERPDCLSVRRRPWTVRIVSLEPERDDGWARRPLEPRGKCLRGSTPPGTLLLPPSAPRLDPGQT